MKHQAFIRIIWMLSCIVVGISLTKCSYAHEIRPALLKINEVSPAQFDVIWKVPLRGNRVLSISPVFPEIFSPTAAPTSHIAPGAWTQHTRYQSEKQKLTGQKFAIKGLSGVQTDVLLTILLQNGHSYSAILKPSSPTFTVPEQISTLAIIASYWNMGLLHILEGIDHLLFLLAMILIVVGIRNLIKTITAFTIAHSITLSLASLALVTVPPTPTEAIISLSIVFLASEILLIRRGNASLTERYPWLIAFFFGLFHGLGFAGALTEIGLPQNNIALALFSFNLGVEAGQILFIALVIGILKVIYSLNIREVGKYYKILPYCIGSIASFWTIERVVSLF